MGPAWAVGAAPPCRCKARVFVYVCMYVCVGGALWAFVCVGVYLCAFPDSVFFSRPFPFFSQLGATEVMEKYLEYLANVVSDFHGDEELRAVRERLADAAARASAHPPLTRQGSRSAPQTRAGSPMPRGADAPAVHGRPAAAAGGVEETEAARRAKQNLALRSMPSSPRDRDSARASQVSGTMAPAQVVASETGNAGAGVATPWGIGPQDGAEATPMGPDTSTTQGPGSVGATAGDSGRERSTPSTSDIGVGATAVEDGLRDGGATGADAAAGSAGGVVEEGPATRPSQLPAHVDVELQPVYGLAREVKLDERVLSRLPGYRRMGPVRVGNANAGMLQVRCAGLADRCRR